MITDTHRYTGSLPMCCRCQTYVRSQRLVGLCYGSWSAASGGSYPPGVRSGLCRSDILTAAELIEDMDDKLFERILWDKNHILHALLPDRRRSLEYEPRPRSHDRELVPKVNSLIESNFLIRQLYKNCY